MGSDHKLSVAEYSADYWMASSLKAERNRAALLAAATRVVRAWRSAAPVPVAIQGMEELERVVDAANANKGTTP